MFDSKVNDEASDLYHSVAEDLRKLRNKYEIYHTILLQKEKGEVKDTKMLANHHEKGSKKLAKVQKNIDRLFVVLLKMEEQQKREFCRYVEDGDSVFDEEKKIEDEDAAAAAGSASAYQELKGLEGISCDKTAKEEGAGGSVSAYQMLKGSSSVKEEGTGGSASAYQVLKGISCVEDEGTAGDSSAGSDKCMP